MLDTIGPLTSSPNEVLPDGELWPEEGLKWVAMPRKSAPGLDALLRWAFELGASRIAFSTGKTVILRLQGRNRFVTRGLLDEGEIADVTNHLYGSDGIARLQNGSDFDVAYEIAVNRTTRLRYRLNATPTTTSRHFGANIVLRPIADMPPPLADQHVEAGILENYCPRNGMTVVGGSVGSGKSTLIAGMTVAKLLDPNGHYNILEGAAPIEFLLGQVKSPSSSIDQTEIPRDLPTFEAFIRGCWRREPTDIIVGECRDGPTMAAAVNAAMAGSALTTTIHVNSVRLTMQRIISLLPVDERANLVNALGQSLRLVINQRLVSSTDGKRTALREFLVFDAALRRQMQRADPSEWPDLAQCALDGQGQSYAAAIQAALEQGRITEQTAAAELKNEES